MDWRRKVLALAGAIVAFGLSSGAFANGPGSGGGGGGPGSGRGAMGGPSAPGGRDTSSSRGVSGMPGAGSPRAPESVPDRGTGPRDADRGAVPPPGGDRSFRPSRGPVFGTGGGDIGGGFGSAAQKSAGRAVTSGGGAPGSIATPSAGSGTADGSQDAYRFRGKQYVRSQGGWFESRGSQLVQVAPPVGLAIDSLPANHETRWIDGVPYFVAGDTYFVWRERERKYEIVEPPAVLPSGEQTLGP